MRVLGIDPGSHVTGYGIVERKDGGLIHIAHGTLRPPRAAELCVRLAVIYQGIVEVASAHRPDQAVVEQVFVAASARSALILGQARGAALAALGAAGLPVAELAAREVKKAVVGTGSAGKAQVQAMVRRILSLEATPATDAADALAVAICRAHAGRLGDLPVRRRSSRSRRRLRAAVSPRPAP